MYGASIIVCTRNQFDSQKDLKLYHCQSLYKFGTTVIFRPPSDNQNLEEEPYWTPHPQKFNRILSELGFKGL